LLGMNIQQSIKAYQITSVLVIIFPSVFFDSVEK